MDSYLIDYLRSGKAWVVVGSGPSAAMGYPSWKDLASVAAKTAKVESSIGKMTALETAMNKDDFPTVFEEAKQSVGSLRLLQALQEGFRPNKPGKIYELMARWPVPVYLTTNYDDEISKHLAALGEAYVPYTNSEDHLAYLLPEASGIVCKLHGDLRSESGLILTASNYQEMGREESWRYWRTKMTSVFQMNRVVIVGHSLKDPHIRHVLEAAKQGGGVLQPVCWIAPDVPVAEARELLEKWRIRVISYDNRQGDHHQLLRLIEHISDFVPPRTAIHISNQIDSVRKSPLGRSAAAPGFFVFNKLSGTAGFEDKRVDVIIAAINSTLPRLKDKRPFDLREPLELAGWPPEVNLPRELELRVAEHAVNQHVLRPSGSRFEFHPEAEALVAERQHNFEHSRERFRTAVTLRLKRAFPALKDGDVQTLSNDVEASLTGYFREGGLTLASMLLSGKSSAKPTIPSSIVKFISEASAGYDDLLRRQAFCQVSVDTFVHATQAERDYLGRVSQGFFAFHVLGAFGDAAAERLNQAKETVWLLDSNAQIPALAVGAGTYAVFQDSFSRLRDARLRLFTTEKLFDETSEHLWFADKMIRQNGPSSPLLLAAASGQAPFRKANVFLEGFIHWQAAGNPQDWNAYLFEIGGSEGRIPNIAKAALDRAGIEVVSLSSWPGFEPHHFIEAEEFAEQIAQKRSELSETSDEGLSSDPGDFMRKSQPEAEALLIVKNEHSGKFFMLSEEGVHSPAWFISNTSILNTFEGGQRITWRPDAFLRFASTLFPPSDEKAVERAFETLVWSIAEAGLNVVDDEVVERVFGGYIDQTMINFQEQKLSYEDTLLQKYGEKPESVLARVSRRDQPLVALQLANEAAEMEAQRRERVEKELIGTAKRAKNAEEKLKELERYKKKINEKKQKAARYRRKHLSNPKKKRGRNR